jgi:hypothetical protein
MFNDVEVNQLDSLFWDFWRPSHHSQLGDAVHQLQKFRVAFDQHGSSSLITAILLGQQPQSPALILRYRIDAILALFASRNDPTDMELPSSATAIGFTAFAPQQVEGTLHHGLGALQLAQTQLQSGVRPPQLLA